MARRKETKKRSIHIVCEHFELLYSTARGTQILLRQVLNACCQLLTSNCDIVLTVSGILC